MIPFLRTAHISAARARPQRGSLIYIPRDNVANDPINRAVALQYFRRVQQVGVKEVLYILEKFWERNHFVIIDDERHADVFDLGLLLFSRIVDAKSFGDCLALAYEHIVGEIRC
jgi:hypothetical protein